MFHQFKNFMARMKSFTLLLTCVCFMSGVAFGQIPSTNLRLHLKADAGTSTTTNDSAVSSWADQSGNGNNAEQTNGGHRPVYKTNVLNGKPVIRFNGTNSYMTLPVPSTMGIQNSDYEMFIVAKSSTVNIPFLIAGGTENYEIHLNGGIGARFIPKASTFIDQGSDGAYVDGSAHIYNAQASSTHGLIRVDGVDGGSISGDMRSSDNYTLFLGVRAVIGYFLDGDIAEVIIYNSILSSTDRRKVEYYLSTKYNLPITYQVNSVSDDNTGDDGIGTLRYVLNTINTNALTSNATVDMTGISGTITLTSALPPLNYNTELLGPGQHTLTISGNNLYRPFFVGAGTSPFTGSSPAAPTVVLKNFSVVNGLGKGGNGAQLRGGGGGAGMGGALFVNAGKVTIENVSFVNNKAEGGAGTVYNNPQGGGGGGFGGDGGTNGSGGSSGLLGETVGGGTGGNITGGDGTAGGFGGGGGAAFTGPSWDGGAGGFGGGGGSGASGPSAFGGASGFAGGNGGGSYGGGGGGGGMGGAVFNRNGTLIVKNSRFLKNTSVGGGGQVFSGLGYAGAIFNYSGFYIVENVEYGTGDSVNSANFSPNIYVYSGTILKPNVTLTPSTNLTATGVTLNGTVNTNNVATNYRFVYGSSYSLLSDTLTLRSAGSSGTVSVNENVTGLSPGTFYYYRILSSNQYGADTSSTGVIVFDTSISSTNLKLWLSAGSGIDSSGGIVAGWFDRSGNNRNALQTSSANRPAYQTNAINGKPVLRFNGTDSFMELPSTSEIGILNTDYEMFIVAKTSNTDLKFIISGGSVTSEIHLNGTIGVRFLPTSVFYLDKGSPGEYADGSSHIYHVRAAGDGGFIRVDNELGGTSTSNVRNPITTPLALGRRIDGTYHFDGDIAEVIVYQAKLSASERNAVLQYLSQRYNIAYANVTEPTIQSEGLAISDVTHSSMKVTVTKGNGSRRIILAKSGGAVDAVPTDGQVYTADSAFGSGAQIGSGNYVVYLGADSVVTVTGLTGNTQYYFSSFELNGNNTDEDYFVSTPASSHDTTLYSPPTVAMIRPVDISLTSATLRAVVNPNESSTNIRFVYGLSAAMLNDTSSVQNIGSGTSADTVTHPLSGLSAGTIYYAKILADNQGGTSVSGTIAVMTDTTYQRSNLKLWLRADAGTSTEIDDEALASWTDISGNGNNAGQSSGSVQPLFKTGVLNGKPVIRFDGTDDFLTTPSTGTMELTGSPYDIVLVAKTNSAALGFFISAPGDNFEGHINGGGGFRFIPKPGVYLDKGAGNEFNDGLPHLFSMRAWSSGAIVRVDGVDGQQYGSDGRSSHDAPFRIGTRAGGIYALNGDIAEILIYNRVLDDVERSTIESSLASKYMISTGALPVELSSFTATPKRLEVRIQWSTATETNNHGFNVERSTAGEPAANKQWQFLGFVEGNGTSNKPNEYAFVDRTVRPGTYLYRLKQIDRDGHFTYYPPVEVNLSSAPKTLNLSQNFPNPFNPSTMIEFTVPADGHTTLKVYSMLGQEVATLVNEHKRAGTYHAVAFDGGKLSSGMYVATLTFGGNVQLKKMLLLK